MSTEGTKTLAELKVAELKTELEKRGLDKNGVKVTLMERLEKALITDGHDPKTYVFSTSQDALVSPSIKKKIAETNENPPVEAIVDNPGPNNDSATADRNQPEPEQLVEVSEANESAHDNEDDQEMFEVEERLETEETIEMIETIEVSQEATDDAQKVPATPEVQISGPLSNSGSEIAPSHSDDPIVPMDTTANEKTDEEPVEIPNLDASEPRENKEKTEGGENEELDYEPNEQTDQEKKLEAGGHEEAESEDQAMEGSVATVESGKPSEMGGEKKDCSLWIRGLPNSIKAADLKTAFSKYGKVITAKIFTTKNKQAPTCFGYITMSDAESAKLCIQNLHKTNLKGRVINVEPAEKMFPNKNPAKIDKDGETGTSANSGEQKEVKKDSVKVRKPVVYKGEAFRARERAILKPIPRRREVIRGRRPVPMSRPVVSSSRGGIVYRSAVRRMITSRVTMARRAEREAYRRELPSLIDYRPSSSYRPGVSSSLDYRASRSIRDLRRRTPERYSSDRAIEKARVERDRMREIMQRREEEHRKREEELRLERERERIRFEREKLEREKLELQQLKQLAALATQPAAYVPVSAMPQQLLGLPASGSSRDRERERERERAKKIDSRSEARSSSRRSRSPMVRRRSPSGTRARGGRGPSTRGGPRGSSTRGSTAPEASRYAPRQDKRSELSAAEKYAAYEREQQERERTSRREIPYPDPRGRPKSPPRHTSASYGSRGSGTTGRGNTRSGNPRGGGYDHTRKIEPRGNDRAPPRDVRDRGYESRAAPPSHYSATRPDPFATTRSTSAYTSSRDAPFSQPIPYNSAATRAAPGYTERYRSNDPSTLPATYRDTQNYSSSGGGGGRSSETWANRASTWGDVPASGSGSSSHYATGSGNSGPWASSGRSDTWQQPSYGSSSSQNIPPRGYDPYALKNASSSSSSRRY